MKICKVLIVAIGVMLGLSSCSVVKQSTYNPNSVELNLDMDDLKYLGDTEISVEYRTYLGFIRAIDVINGERYDGQVVKRAHVRGCSNAALQRATYKIFEEYPEADYLVVSRERTDISRLFLGSEIKSSAKVKAYKLK